MNKVDLVFSRTDTSFGMKSFVVKLIENKQFSSFFFCMSYSFSEFQTRARFEQIMISDYLLYPSDSFHPNFSACLICFSKF